MRLWWRVLKRSRFKTCSCPRWMKSEVLEQTISSELNSKIVVCGMGVQQLSSNLQYLPIDRQRWITIDHDLPENENHHSCGDQVIFVWDHWIHSTELFFYFVIVIFFFPHQTWRETIPCTIEGVIFVGIFTGTEVSPQLQKHILLVLLKWNWHKLKKKIPAFHHDEIHKLNVIAAKIQLFR